MIPNTSKINPSKLVAGRYNRLRCFMPQKFVLTLEQFGVLQNGGSVILAPGMLLELDEAATASGADILAATASGADILAATASGADIRAFCDDDLYWSAVFPHGYHESEDGTLQLTEEETWNWLLDADVLYPLDEIGPIFRGVHQEQEHIPFQTAFLLWKKDRDRALSKAEYLAEEAVS